MEFLEEKIKKFLKVNSGSGDGFGSGSGYGYGDGYGFGSGSGSGFGSGFGFGSGSGYGSGYGLKSINKNKIYIIDNIQTIITNIKGNVAKGFIINKDLTLTKTYIVKNQNKFAHGETIKEAMEDLQNKIYEELDVDERIEEFWKHFNKTSKYSGKEFYNWHKNLTGSCKQGRDTFVKNHNLSLTKKYTVKEFINICKNDYMGEIIQRLEEVDK